MEDNRIGFPGPGERQRFDNHALQTGGCACGGYIIMRDGELWYG